MFVGVLLRWGGFVVAQLFHRGLSCWLRMSLLVLVCELMCFFMVAL